MPSIQPPDRRGIRTAESLERVASIAIRLGQVGVFIAVPHFIGYVLIGVLVSWTGLFRFPYPFLSLTSDPVFNILGFVVGIAILLTSGGLLILLMMNKLQRIGNQIAIILVGISLGSSAAILRHTYTRAISSILSALTAFLKFVGGL